MKPVRLFLLLFLLVGLAFPAEAGKTVVILIDGLELKDITSYPGLRLWAERGAIGLMNIRSAGRTNSASSHLSLGAGARAQTGSTGGWSFNSHGRFDNIPVEKLFELWAGQKSHPGAVLHLGIAQTQSLNANWDYTVEPGLLGSSLRQGGKTTWVIGNSDTAEAFRRFGVLLAMDDSGIVDGGDVSRDLLLWDDTWPYGWRTDYAKLADAWQEAWSAADFIVLELGDLSRLEVHRHLFLPEQMDKLRSQALVTMDQFLQELWSQLKEAPPQVFILAPTPGSLPLQRGHQMAPLIYYGGPRGLVSSATTRRPGICANYDLAPTILAGMGLPIPDHLAGAILEAEEHKEPMTYLSQLWEQMVIVYDQRGPILQNFVIAQIALYLTVVLLVWLGQGGYLLIYKGLLLSLMAVPLILLFLVPRPELRDTTLLLIGGALVLGFGGARLWRDVVPFIFMALATAVAISFDVLAGAPRLSTSILGYDAMVGARYYGMGNEYMGVYLSSLLVGVSGMLDLWPRLRPYRSQFILIIGVGAIILLAGTNYGANVGGTMAAVVGLGWIWWRFSGRPFTFKAVLAIALVLLGILLLSFGYDYLWNTGQPSHLSRTTALMLAEGPGALVAIARRKILLNLRLMRYTYWTRILLTSLGILFFFFLKPVTLVQNMQREFPYLTAGLRASLISGLAALVFNDSGVVAASTALVPIMPIILYLIALHGYRGHRLFD
ncbi:MAG: hypothetical protein ACOYD6_07775 [Limnochordia bacterium]